MSYDSYLISDEALDDIYREIRLILPEAFRLGHDRLLAAWKAIGFILDTSCREGLLVLEEKLMEGEIEKFGAPNYDMLSKIIIWMADAYDREVILYMMSNDYYVNDYDIVDRAALFFYMVCVLGVLDQGEDFQMERTAGKNFRNFWRMKKEVMLRTGDITDEHFFQMCSAVWQAYEIGLGAFEQGLRYIEREAEILKSTGNDMDLFFADGICFLCKGRSGVREYMMDKYSGLAREPGKDWMRMLYIEAAYLIEAGLKPHLLKEICIGMLPAGKREQCRKVIKKMEDERTGQPVQKNETVIPFVKRKGE